jgi:hypothetical protein
MNPFVHAVTTPGVTIVNRGRHLQRERYGLSARERRWPWLLTAGLMLAAAVAAACSTYLQWLPCRGSMSRDECWRRMDAGISFTGAGFPYLPDLAEAPPWVSELGTAATVLVGVAWLRSFSGCGGS